MSKSMFDYTKMILNKVSFDPVLFCKEVQKAVSRLLPHEIEELRNFILRIALQKPELKQSLIYLD
ncbi:hypothetical protein [Mesonia sp. HuA40]|uniref:hypothetical protein n=1 Tax=Mesonia sp. HuA40 TaxID=2602761 RepID=UPI0011CA5863|nr:hypothetical protein [Mesonia sp. HuA40]TXK70247.1 hypothetical protein FT993_12215 [Mesonia sp. HuA40]